jgi:NAD+ kinase
MPSPLVALNDVLVGRGELSRVVRIAVSLDGVPFTTYVGDGVLVATPTGSTAYNLAAHGPIVDPRLRTTTLVPLLPYLTFPYPVVLAPDTVVELDPGTRSSADVGGGEARCAMLSVDGQVDLGLAPGQKVRVSSDPRPSRFLRLRPPAYFYTTLTRRLRPDHFWSDPVNGPREEQSG